MHTHTKKTPRKTKNNLSLQISMSAAFWQLSSTQSAKETLHQPGGAICLPGALLEQVSRHRAWNDHLGMSPPAPRGIRRPRAQGRD